ncbi:hypothetical protein JXB41_05615 [Candidatus Woesearchaeota archaeon]|nr:hypothetical protein [Candidatus Woesearchaeota archaeon]
MQKLEILNKKRIKEFSNLIKRQWNCDFSFSEFAVFMNRNNRIFIISKDVSKLRFEELRINNLGLYFGEINSGELRLSIEGAQIIGRTAQKDILELNDKQSKEWMSGMDLEIDSKINGFVIIKNKDDFLGCGKVVNGKLLNYVPKVRREKN